MRPPDHPAASARLAWPGTTSLAAWPSPANTTKHSSELRRAVELGYRDFTFMKQDRDLDPIRKDPRFRALVREYERKR